MREVLNQNTWHQLGEFLSTIQVKVVVKVDSLHKEELQEVEEHQEEEDILHNFLLQEDSQVVEMPLSSRTTTLKHVMGSQ